MNSDIGTMFTYELGIYNNLIIIITDDSNLQFNMNRETEYYANDYSYLIELGLTKL